ncbi:MAG TPA: glycosyltransferase family 9 protein, partial [Puia sp.]|nr:glycosyltransferase family 9 protein [Puia sp.]
MITKKEEQLVIPAVRWKKPRPPRRILAIRLQAMGDLVITLPYLQQLRNSLPPNTVIDLLTRKEVESIPRHLKLFNRVYSIRGGRNGKKQLLFAVFLIPVLLFRRYEIVLDLQDNIISRLVMKSLRPRAWSLFDRFSLESAGNRTQATIEAVGLGNCKPATRFSITNEQEAIALLKAAGWAGGRLVVLNPAGAFETRHWPLENYIQFAHLWLERFPDTQFLVLGTGIIEKRSTYIKIEMGDCCISLVNKTTAAQAFAVLQQVQLVLSEDSGLMHMAWVSGIPVLAMFGSTESKKARPLGKHSRFVDSSDLP